MHYGDVFLMYATLKRNTVMTTEEIINLIKAENTNQSVCGWKSFWETYHPTVNCGGGSTYVIKEVCFTRHIFKLPSLGLSISIDKNAKEVIVKGLAQSSFNNEEDWKPNESRAKEIEGYISDLVSYFFGQHIHVKAHFSLKKVMEDDEFYWAYNPKIYKIKTKTGHINFLASDCMGVLK